MISMIAAIGKNGELGKNNDLIFKLKKDMTFFVNKTTNHKVVMGLNTYKSIGHPLKNRDNVVITHDLSLVNGDGLKVYNNMEELITKELNNEEENFIIGGVMIYNYFYNICDRMYLTLIDAECDDADAFFPKINYDDWNITILGEDEEDGLKFKYALFERK